MRSMLAGVAETGSAPPQAVRDCFFTTLPPLRGPPPLTQGRRIQTPLGEACKRASHTRKSLQPLRGFRTRLGDACKHASHTCKSLYTREPKNFPITEVSFACFSFQRKVRCLLFFSKKSMVIDLSAVRLYRRHWLPRLCGAGRRSRRTRCRFRA